MAEKKVYYDHLGNQFNTKKEMCKAWNINVKSYSSRISRGYSVKDALIMNTSDNVRGVPTGLKTKGYVKDHLGNIFLSTEAMCKHYHVDNAFYYKRLRKTNNLQFALTGIMSED